MNSTTIMLPMNNKEELLASLFILLYLLEFGVVTGDETSIRLESNRRIVNNSISYCPDSVTSNVQENLLNGICIITCIVAADGPISPHLELNGTLDTIEAINGSSKYHVEHNATHYNLEFRCEPLRYRCCFLGGEHSTELYVKEDWSLCERGASTEPPAPPSNSEIRTVVSSPPTYAPTNQSEINNGTVTPIPMNNQWKIAVGVVVGVIGLVLLGIILCVASEVIYIIYSQRQRGRHPFIVPTEEEGDPENKAGNLFTASVKIFTDSKESIYTPIEESASNIVQDSRISYSATEMNPTTSESGSEKDNGVI